MNIQLSPKHATAVCLVLWGVLVTIYLVLGIVRHDTLPVPYDTLIMLMLAVATLVAAAAWLSARDRERTAARLGALEDAVRDAMTQQDRRDGKIYVQAVRIRRRLDDLELPTVQLTRRLVVVGTASVPPQPRPVDPEVINLSRRIHQKMIEGDPA